MGTRSDIIVQHSDGTWKRIYCHWDGYLSHNGRIIFKHYNSQKLAEALVRPGDLSSLAPKCNKPAGHSFDNQKEGYSVYYGRDRGENNVAGTIGATMQEVWPKADTWTEFTYVWSHDHGIPAGAWYVTAPEDSAHLILLSDALQGGEKPKALVKAFGMVLGQHK